MTEILDRVVALARALIPDCDGAAVAVGGADGALQQVARSGEVDVHAAAAVAAVRTGEPQRGAGPRGYLAVPLLVRDAPVGVLALAGPTEAGFADADVQGLSDTLAQHAAISVALARLAATGDVLYDELARSHDVVDQAHGVLMARTGCDAATAAAELATDADRHGRSLDDMAASVVASTQPGR